MEEDEKDMSNDIETPGRTGEDDAKQEFKEVKNPFSEFTLTQLKQMLDEAIAIEDYSKAARLRDEIAKRK